MQGSPYAAGGPGASPTAADYEFNASENIVLRELASSMSFVGLFNAIGGVLLAVLGVLASLGTGPLALIYVVQGIVNFLIGIWTRSSASAFTRVVDTEGNDIANLMQALHELRRVYNLQKIVIIVTIVLVVIAILLAILFALRVPPRTSV
jgi:hypothetical protein